MEPKPLVGVIAATGRVGRFVIQKLLERNYQVKVLVRNVENAKKMFPQSEIQFARADLTEKQSLEEGLQGCSKVICCSGGFSLFGLGALTGNKNRPYHVDYLGIINLTEACKSQTQPPHLVLISSIGVTRTTWSVTIGLNIFCGMVMKWKLKGENYLRESGIPYTIVRPSGLLDNNPPLTKSVLLGQGDTFSGNIDRIVVADIMVECLSQPKAMNTTFEITYDSNNGNSISLESQFNSLKTDLERGQVTMH